MRRALAFLLLALAGGIAAAAEPVTLRFTVWDGDESLKVIRRLLAGFERENPDIKVKLENFGDYNLYHQKMLTQYAANVAPDVAMEDMPHFQALAKRGALLPLNPFFEKTPGFDINEYYKPIVDAHSMDGQVYVLPRDIAPMGLIYYNKKAFDEAGIPYPDGTWTWDFKERPELREKDFVWVCRQLTKPGKDVKSTRWAFASGWPQLLAETFFYSTGQYPADDPENPTKLFTDTPEAIRAFQYASDFMNKLKYMPNSTETSGALMQTTQQLFVSQKIAMYQNGIWEVPNVRKMMKPGDKNFFEWDITLFPAYANPGGQPIYGAPTGGSGYAIFSSTPYPEQAWRLVKYMSGPVAMEAMAKAGIAQPAIRRLALQPGIWIPGPDTPIEQRYPYSRIFTDKAVPYVKFSPTSDAWPSVSERIWAGLDLVWNGQATAEETLKRSTAIAQKRLDTIRKEERLPPFDWNVGGLLALAIVGGIVLWTFWPERKIKYTPREKRESRTAFLFASPWIVGMIVFTLGPMIFSLLISLADWDIITPARWRGLGNYHEAFAVDPLFWKSLIVTGIYTVVSVPLGLCMSLALALLLNVKVWGMPLFRSLYYVPSLASGVAASLIWRRVFSPDSGLVNAVLYSPWFKTIGLGLSEWAGTPGKNLDWFGNEKTALPALIIMSVWGAGGGMVILLAGLQGIPQFYYEAATLDGASVWQRFKAVTIPLLTPTLFFSLVTGFIGSFQVFTQAYVITAGGPNDTTRFYMLHLWRAAFESLRMGYASAGAWVLFAIIMVVTLIQVKGSKRWVYYESEAK